MRARSCGRPSACTTISALIGGGLAGQIRVLSNTNALTEFLPEALSSFLTAHPNVSVDLEERLSDEIVGLIAEGVADLGIVAGTVDAGALATYPFRRDRFVLVVARDHPLASRAKVGFDELLDHDFVGLDRASALQRFLTSKAVRIGRPLRLRVQLRSFDAVCRLVECKVGIGIVPETTARRAARTMAIAMVPLADSWAVRELTICVRDINELPLYARQLVEHLRAPDMRSRDVGKGDERGARKSGPDNVTAASAPNSRDRAGSRDRSPRRT